MASRHALLIATETHADPTPAPGPETAATEPVAAAESDGAAEKTYFR
ncbi:hypothetical protein ACWEF6_38465 [Amycolatopsis sp. NPDC004772]